MIGKFPFASEGGPSRLYHYQTFRLDYLIAMLRDQRIHCSNPANLNDPWDCRPFFDTSFVNDSNERRLWIKWLEQSQEQPIPAKELDRLQNDPDFLFKTICKLSEDFSNLIPQRWGIYCLTPVATSTLMWSHYADNHKGICLEFSTENNRLFAHASKVDYRKSYPRIAPYILEDLKQLLLTKSNDWEYEQEYRVVARRQPGPLDSQLGTLFLALDGYLSLPPQSLLSVIVGCEHKDFDAVRRAVKEHAPGVALKRAVRLLDKYRIEIQDVP